MEYFKIIKNLLNKIFISDLTYIFLLISLFAGYFEYLFILLFFILIHELGHLIIASLFNFEINKIIIYPFGGNIKFNILLNTEIYKELLVAISGPIIQIFLFLLLSLFYSFDYINITSFEKIKTIHILLLSFNLLPIIPLDGGKIINLLLNKMINYKLSDKLSLSMSLAFIIIISVIYRNIFIISILILLVKNVYFEFKNLKPKFNKFLVERYLYNFKYKKIKRINNVNKLHKEKKHIINNISEEKYLNDLFDLNKKIC